MSRLLDGEVDHVVKRTVLSDSDEYRLVVSRCVDGREAVRTRWETVGDIRRDDTVDCSSVDTLEERERVRVRRGRLVQAAERLDNDVRVTNDVSGRVDLLRRTVVVVCGVHEVTSLKIVDSHRDGKRSVRLNGSEVSRECELGGWHVRRRRDDTHRCRVA